MTDNVRNYMTLARMVEEARGDDELEEALEEAMGVLWERMTKYERNRFNSAHE